MFNVFLIMANENTTVCELTSENFDEKISKNKGYSVVDFFAPWCGPCRMMAPYLEEIS